LELGNKTPPTPNKELRMCHKQKLMIRSQGAWKNANTYYVTMKKESDMKVLVFSLTLKQMYILIFEKPNG